MDTVLLRRDDVLATLDEFRHTPLTEIPVKQATDVAKRIMARREINSNVVEVARFGSAV